MAERAPLRPLLAAVALAATLALVLAASGALLAADSDASHRVCHVRGTQTIVVNSRGRIYRRVRQQPDRTIVSTYVCLNRYRRHILLRRDVRPSDGGGVVSHSYRLTSPFVAYAAAEEDPTSGELFDTVVYVVDARSGRLRRRSGEIEGGASGVLDLELTRTASVAWIDDGDPTVRYRVQALDRGGQRVLDSGPGIVPDSLTRSGQTISWVNDGAARSATLP